MIGGYLVAYAMLLITGARLGQTHGYKRLFLVVPLTLGRGAGWPAWTWACLAASLTNSVADDYAPDIRGVSTTTLQIGGAIGVAAFGSLYIALAASPSPSGASHAFAITTVALGMTALTAAIAAYLATHVERDFCGYPTDSPRE